MQGHPPPAYFDAMLIRRLTACFRLLSPRITGGGVRSCRQFSTTNCVRLRGALRGHSREYLGVV